MSKMKAGGGIMSKMAPSKMSKVKTSAKPDGVAKKGSDQGQDGRDAGSLNETEPGYGCHP
jgi:hypothetical protein